jgi:hypothetical protein
MFLSFLGGNLPTAAGAPITREDERSSARLAMIRNSSSFRRAVRGVAALERMMSPTTDAKQLDKPVSANKKSAPTLTGIRRTSSLGTGLKSLQNNLIGGEGAKPQYSNGTNALQGEFLRSESMDSASSRNENTFPAVNPHDHWVTIDLRGNEASTAEPSARADTSAAASVSERAWSGRWSLSNLSNLRGVMFPLRRSTSDLVLQAGRPPV